MKKEKPLWFDASSVVLLLEINKRYRRMLVKSTKKEEVGVDADFLLISFKRRVESLTSFV